MRHFRAWHAWFLLTLGACSRREATESRAPAPQPAREPLEQTAEATAKDAKPSQRSTDEAARRAEERHRLVDRVAQRGVQSAAVLQAMRRVPRHAFVPESWAQHAYDDRPLPIGHGQTISQPTVVGAMTEAAAPLRTDKCLEIGTGSGYQAAVLAELCARVFSIEYLAPLAAQAATALRAAGYGPDRVALRTGDGYAGWPEAAPFDVILVTAAPERVPQPLFDQLAVDGRLVVPVGAQGEVQQLELFRRKSAGSAESSFEKRTLMQVRFVPFLGEAAAKP